IPRLVDRARGFGGWTIAHRPGSRSTRPRSEGGTSTRLGPTDRVTSAGEPLRAGGAPDEVDAGVRRRLGDAGLAGLADQLEAELLGDAAAVHVGQVVVDL